MFGYLLSVHSLNRYIVLVLLIVMLVRCRRMRNAEKYSHLDIRLTHLLTWSALIQLAVGVALYAQSPLIRYFYASYPETLHVRPARFFSMEHSTVMFMSLLAMILFNLLHKPTVGKYKKQFRWYLVILILIFVNVPWPFSPVVARPWLTLIF